MIRIHKFSKQQSAYTIKQHYSFDIRRVWLGCDCWVCVFFLPARQWFTYEQAATNAKQLRRKFNSRTAWFHADHFICRQRDSRLHKEYLKHTNKQIVHIVQRQPQLTYHYVKDNARPHSFSILLSVSAALLV